MTTHERSMPAPTVMSLSASGETGGRGWRARRVTVGVGVLAAMAVTASLFMHVTLIAALGVAPVDHDLGEGVRMVMKRAGGDGNRIGRSG